MEIRAFGNNGHYKYHATRTMESRIVDDHGTNNNDYFISINSRKLNSSGKPKGPLLPARYAYDIDVDLKLHLITYTQRIYCGVRNLSITVG